MTVDFGTDYPKALTNSAWQKNKTFKDKRKKVTKTGLGTELEAAEKAYKAITFTHLSAKNFTPKTGEEARRNLENAKFVVTQKVKPAMLALDEARKKALATAKIAELSDGAKAAAAEIAKGLDLRHDLLGTINVNDFKVAITKVEAAAVGGKALQKVRLQKGNQTLGVGKKGIRQKDGSVKVFEITWDESVADPKTLLNTTVTLRSAYEDNATFLNDMKFAELSSTSKTGTFK